MAKTPHREKFRIYPQKCRFEPNRSAISSLHLLLTSVSTHFDHTNRTEMLFKQETMHKETFISREKDALSQVVVTLANFHL